MTAPRSELFNDAPPSDMLSAFEARLPQKTYVKVSDIAAAADVDTDIIYGWIDAGLVEAVNLGSRERAYWKVFRPSVIAFYQRRISGK